MDGARQPRWAPLLAGLPRARPMFRDHVSSMISPHHVFYFFFCWHTGWRGDAGQIMTSPRARTGAPILAKMTLRSLMALCRSASDIGRK
jgi:hypothetical protein